MNPSGIWGWISNNKMLATVVEKAKVTIFPFLFRRNAVRDSDMN